MPSDATVLQQDHIALRREITTLTQGIAEVNGKVDTVIAVLEKMSDRQDRHEARVERFEIELDRIRIRHADDMKATIDVNERKLEKSERALLIKLSQHEQRIESLSNRVWLFSGGVGVVAFVLPFIIKAILG